MLPEKIAELKKRIIEDAALVEDMIEKAIKGLKEKDMNILNSVINTSEEKVNEFEIQIDELCINTIALFQPEAKDLRTILMILKMNNDLERMGDMAVNIAESSLFLIDRPEVKKLIDIPRMGKETIQMLHDSISSFINEDAPLARDVVTRDDLIDGLRDQVIRELITYMSKDTSVIERSLHLVKISQNLERIADLTTNICEDVIFIVNGKVIKHHYENGNSQ